MADAFTTTTQIAYFNDDKLGIGQVSEVLAGAPVLAALFARTIPGYIFKYPRKTANPSGGFRAENDGRENEAPAREQVTVTSTIMDASFIMDVATAEASEAGVEAALGQEAADHLEGALANVETQIFYGTGNDSAGFAGIVDNADYDALADDMVINANGDTADTGSSVFAIRSGPKDVNIVWGQNGQIDLGERTVQRVAGSVTGTYPAYYVPVTAWCALQIGGKFSVGRLANCTEDSDDGCTDAKIATLLEQFPSDKWPTMLAMSRRSLRQLRASRTATHPTGAPAPFPTESFGVPIITSNNVSVTEAIEV